MPAIHMRFADEFVPNHGCSWLKQNDKVFSDRCLNRLYWLYNPGDNWLSLQTLLLKIMSVFSDNVTDVHLH